MRRQLILIVLFHTLSFLSFFFFSQSGTTVAEMRKRQQSQNEGTPAVSQAPGSQRPNNTCCFCWCCCCSCSWYVSCYLCDATPELRKHQWERACRFLGSLQTSQSVFFCFFSSHVGIIGDHYRLNAIISICKMSPHNLHLN